MSTPREVKLRIQSVKNIAQVTRALQAVSASRVRRATDALEHTRPYATKAWQVLTHVAGQPDREVLHPLLITRPQVGSVLVVVVSGDRGLAGPYYSNVMRYTQKHFGEYDVPVSYVAVGRKGADLLFRLGKQVIADFTDLPAEPAYTDVSPIARLVIDEFLAENTDEVYLVYTDFINMIQQKPTHKKLLPLEFQTPEGLVEAEYGGGTGARPSYTYEPGRIEILDEIIPSFTGLQVFHAVLESLASEHAARMVAMKNATDNASDLAEGLQLEYNKARQQAITEEMLDIAGGAEALAQSRQEMS